MSASLVQIYVLWDGNSSTYVGSLGQTITVNCETVEAFSPRPVWLKRFLAPGDGTVVLYEPTFFPTSQELLDPNTLQGFWIEQDGKDVIVDVNTAATFLNACNACCPGSSNILTSTYGGNPPAFAPLAINTICVVRNDSGSANAHDNFAFDYTGQFIGNIIMRSNFSGVSHYSVTTYWTALTFPLMGTDTATAGVCAS